MESVSRRDFTGLAALLVGALATLSSEQAESQVLNAVPSVPPSQSLKPLVSGVFKPQAGKGMQGGHESHQFLSGLLTAGNIRLEMHESIQQPGAPHEAVGTHKHSEIWLVQRGVASLYLNGTEHRMEAGDVGICCAGDEHWIRNAGETDLAYFVVTVGPPE